MSTFNYNEFKKDAIKFQPLQQKVDLSEIDITDQGQIIIKGIACRTADNVLSELLKILGINTGFINRFGGLMDQKAKFSLIKMIKEALVVKNKSSKSMKNLVTIVGDNESKEITHILSGDIDIISNEMALDLFEKTFEPGVLEIIDGSVGVNKLELTVRKNIEVLPEVNGIPLKGEEFNPGFNFKNSLIQGVSIETYMERLVCTNGMTAKGYFGDISVNRVEPGKIQEFFKDFINIQKNNFVSKAYGENIERATKTNASFSELMQVKNLIVGNSTLVEKDVYSVLPEWNREVNRLAAANIDFEKCNAQQLKNHPTKSNLWDVINRLTDFGSHDYGFNVDKFELQRAAGLLLNKKDYDSTNILILG